MEATFSCPQCSFCVDHDVMLRVLKHFFNCTSFQYIMDLSCGHHPGLGHSHITGAPQHKKYKHTSYNSVSSVNKDMGSQDRSVQEEPAIEESMAENELDNSTTMVPSVEVKTEPPDDTESTVFEPAAPPAQLMDTAAFREDCHPVSVVCAMGGIQDTSALAGSSSDPGETETHTITTEPVGAPSMVVTRPSAMAASRAQPGSAHDNRDGGGLDTNMWNYLSNIEESSSGTPRKRRNRKKDRYSCPEDGCERTFRDKYEMTNHLRTHTGEKPFKCDWPGCDKYFTHVSSKAQHYKSVHIKYVPHKCSKCGKGFTKPSQMKRHEEKCSLKIYQPEVWSKRRRTSDTD